MNRLGLALAFLLPVLLTSDGRAQDTGLGDPLEPTPLLAAVAPQVIPPGNAALPGNNSITASLIEVQNQIDRSSQAAANPGGEPNTFDFYLEQYDHFHSPPYLFIIGLPLGQVLADPLCQATLWAALLLCLALAIAARFRPGVAGARDLDYFATLLLKLAALALLLAAPNLVYAAGMTIMNCGERFVRGLRSISARTPDGVTSRLADVLSHAGTFDLELMATRNRAIRNGLADRQGIFSKFTEDKLKVAAADYWACFFNQLAAAQQAAFANGQNYTPIPRAGQATTEDILSRVVGLYIGLALDSAAIDARPLGTVSFSLDWQYGPYAARRRSLTVDPLANRIQQTTREVYNALRQTASSPDGLTLRQALLQQYEKTIRAATANWVDVEYIDGFAQALSGIDPLVNVVRDIGSWTKRGSLGLSRSLRAPGLLSALNGFMTLGVDVLQFTLVPMLSFATCFCFRILLELNLLALLFLGPLWLLDPTARAFRNAVWTFGVCVVTLPCYQFFQLVLDLLFAALSNLITTGSLVFVAQPALLPEAMLTILFGLAVGYFVAVVLLAVKTPSLVNALLTGGGWAAQVLGVAARGLVISAMAAAAGFSAARSALGGGRLPSAPDLLTAGRSAGPGRSPPPVFSAGRRKVWLRAARETVRFGEHLLRNGGSPVASGLSYVKARKEKGNENRLVRHDLRRERNLDRRHQELLRVVKPR